MGRPLRTKGLHAVHVYLMDTLFDLIETLSWGKLYVYLIWYEEVL
ncbi:MAG: hypothetical protein RML36_07540 [Anaerolineae bacterium]|nr:hypothetical protein [Anaerolineae bacterium]MDW8099320.1 hypothetical protein [Anaerolineae bacterium]